LLPHIGIADVSGAEACVKSTLPGTTRPLAGPGRWTSARHSR
jgi:hypothetical protein